MGINSFSPVHKSLPEMLSGPGAAFLLSRLRAFWISLSLILVSNSEKNASFSNLDNSSSIFCGVRTSSLSNFWK